MRKRIYLNLAFLCFTLVGFSQEGLSLKTGKNFTKFNYIDKQGNSPGGLLQSDVGSWYSFGYARPFSEDRYGHPFFTLESALSIGDYNSVVGVKGASYQWKTVYVGIDNSIIFSLINAEYVGVGARLGLNFASIVYGKENIDGVVYDIKGADGFRGMTFQGVVGLQANLFPSKVVSYTIGYDYLSSLNTSVKSPEKLSLATNRFWVGVNLNINN
jgi:hypothetical protein